MKILSIRLKNLASLSGEHFIDFESNPLASAGLIAIVGKTGAGKSTILDAMCLALFNKIPRLKDSDGKLLDVDGSELLTNSPLTVLRRGTGHGFAELCFIAQDQKAYLARWEIKRARENANGKLQSAQRYLKCLTDGVVVADKTKAVDEHIRQITQLSFEQFTRAVLLAQSEVTVFLKARDAERGELLEYLTNSTIFAKIGQLAYEKTKQVKLAREKLQDRLGHIEILTEDQLREIQQKFSLAQQAYQQLETEKVKLGQQQQWFEHEQKLQNEILLKQQQYDTQLKTQEALATDRKQLTQLETFSDIRPVVFQQQQILNQQQQLAPQIEQTQQSFTILSTEFAQEKNRYTQAETALHQLQIFEDKYQAELAQVRKYVQERDYIAEEYKKTKNRLTQIEQQQSPLLDQQQQLAQSLEHLSEQLKHSIAQLQQSQAFSALDKGLHAHITQLSQFINQYQKTENALGNIQLAQSKLKQDQTLLSQLTQQFGTLQQIDMQLEQQHKAREQQLSRLNQLESIQQKLQHYFELQQEAQQLTQKIKEGQDHVQQFEQNSLNAEHAFQTAKTEHEKLQHILQQQRLLHSENIEHLRAELKQNEACLVCGSTEHPYRDDESAVSKALFTLQQQQELQAIQYQQQCLQTWQASQRELTQATTAQQQYHQALQQIQQRLNVQTDQLQQDCNLIGLALDLNATPTEILAQLQQLTTNCTTSKQQLEQLLQQLNQARKQQAELIHSIQNTTHQLDTVQQLQQHIQHIVDCLTADEKAQWHAQTLTVSQQILQRLQQRAQQLDQSEYLTQQKQNNAQQLDLLKSNLTSLHQQHSELQTQRQEIEARGKRNTDAAHQLIIGMTASTDLKANEWLSQHDQQRQHLQQQYQQLKQHFEQSRQHFEQQKNILEQLKVQQQQYQNEYAQCTSKVHTWLSQHSDFQEQQLLGLLSISSVQEQHIRSTLQHADRLLNEANSALKTLQDQLHQHLKQQPEQSWADLQQQLSDHQHRLTEQVEQRDQFKLSLELHQQNLVKRQQFATEIEQIQQEEHRWHKISSLIGDSKGKEFRDLAQQYNLDILLEYANQQLTLLSQRYTLTRLDNSLSLAIVDHDMDGEKRSVASLSGGESFLTALALSLAIANMASGSMKIESLFIDEGFGTLDASSLHMVMNALDQLQNQGRKVVLISHIQEMHERIPVQIQVKPMGSGASSIQIVG